jgi:hypothetical protein
MIFELGLELAGKRISHAESMKTKTACPMVGECVEGGEKEGLSF